MSAAVMTGFSTILLASVIAGGAYLVVKELSKSTKGGSVVSAIDEIGQLSPQLQGGMGTLFAGTGMGLAQTGSGLQGLGQGAGNLLTGTGALVATPASIAQRTGARMADEQDFKQAEMSKSHSAQLEAKQLDDYLVARLGFLYQLFASKKDKANAIKDFYRLHPEYRN